MAEPVAGSPEGGLKVSSSSGQDLRFGPFHFDVANRFLYRDGVALPLPPRAVGVLAVLLAQPGQVVSKQALLDEVWKDTNVTDTSLAEAVSLLRQALRRRPATRRLHPDGAAPRLSLRRPLEAPRGTTEVTGAAARSVEDALWTPWLPWVLAVARRHPDHLGGVEPAPARDAAARDHRAIHHRAAAGIPRRRRSPRPRVCPGLLGHCVCRLARRRASCAVPAQPGRRRFAPVVRHRRGRGAIFLSRRARDRLLRRRPAVASRPGRRGAASHRRRGIAGRGCLDP